MGQFCYCSLSPQGDDNLSDHYGSYKIYIAAYPRKGTITMGPGQRRCGHQIAAYPRKGTITPRCSPGGWSAEYCSLSPQGDDNPKFYTSFLTTNNCSLSPQGDDNLSDHYGSYKIYIAAYPRKGTITMGPGQRRCGHQIAAYPRKGTITSKCFLFVVSHHIAAYPRKGTITAREQKTPHQKRCGVFLLQTLTLCFPWAVPL